MRVFVCLGVLLAAGAAQAQTQTLTTTINRDSRTVTISGPGYTATATRASPSSTTVIYSVTTVNRANGAYHPMGAAGYSPMGH
jgi:uncharacterized protein YggE